jgi:hypothetical protein
MPYTMRLRLAASCALAALYACVPAMASNNRSWVSQSGSDLNDCSIAHPCLTFQHAHDQTLSGGEVDVLDPGDYGTLLISHAITLDGGNMGYINNPTASLGILVKTSPNDTVIVRNLSITPAQGAITNAAIQWTGGQRLFVENVSINGFGTGIDVEPSPYDPIIVRQLFVSDGKIRNCTSYGISMGLGTTAAFNATIARTIIENINGEGSGIAISLVGGRANVTQSVISQANIYGVYVYGGELHIEDSSVDYANTGLFAGGNGIIRMAANNVHNNRIALVPQGGQILSFGTNRISGNGGGETPSGGVALK